ncbi:MAG: PAC2 family protein, partial [Dehalococcoidia bacterium]|nr:PAC2 family protein [Dehalococcoidia bacterium]
MKIGAFEFPEPVPELRTPHVIASLTPWVDAGSIATVTLKALERQSGAQDLGSLATPGTFFDFTRYRPVVEYQDDQRRITLPNTRFRWSRGPKGFDFILLHMLEPHAFAEEYIDSILKVLEHFKVSRMCRIGGMYDAVPHTRPLLVTGSLNGEPLQGVSGITPPEGNRYQGPTSIAFLMGDKLTELGIENMNLMARLPQYVQLEEDYNGAARLLDILCRLYDLPPEPALGRRGV